MISIVDGDTRSIGLALWGGSDGSTIRGLNIQGFGTGIEVTSSSNLFVGNYLGTNAAGTAAAAKAYGLNILQGDNNIIGGLTAADRNVISGNSDKGIVMTGGADNIQVLGNYIGTNAVGTAALRNLNNGIYVDTGVGLVLGGSATGARNIISGNGNGVYLNNGDNCFVQGNYFGLSVDGTTAVGNVWTALTFAAGSCGNLIGTNADGSNDTAERNVISANQDGLVLDGAGTTNNQVYGNYIGTDVTGLVDWGNTSDGVRILNGATGNFIGGATSTRRNVIAGNDGDGIEINGEASDGNTIQNNFIGLGANGATILGNGNSGIQITGGADNTIIGGVGLGNTIVGSTHSGISLDGASSGTVIYGNFIGVDSTGTIIGGNLERGILLANGATNNTIGGTTAGQGNTITASGLGGVYTAGIEVANSALTGNAIIGNSIYDNAGIGIDLGDIGVTANDALDPDTGANNLQNFTIITQATTNGSTVVISGSLNSLANVTGMILHFYATPATGNLTRRDARRYLGSTTVNTDASGNATFTNVSLTAAVASWETLTATATSPGANGNTSELSQTFVVNSAPVLADTSLSITITEDAGVPSGTVGSLISSFTGGITDADSGAVKGIA